jgi:uncharacterized protein
MRYFVWGVDSDAAAEQLELLAEVHWTYMDEYADRLVARGPTLSPDGKAHTGSVHVLAADGAKEAHRFAFDEPYSLAGVYSSVTVTRFHSALTGTMWDRPLPPPGATSSLVMVTWQAQSFAPAAEFDARMLRRLAETDSLVFGGLLISDDAATSVGLAAAFDVGVEQASTIVAGIELPEPTTRTMTCRWQRGGRDQE